MRFGGWALVFILAGRAAPAAELAVVGLAPPRNMPAPVSTAISIEFDQPLNPVTVTTVSFRVFGRSSGPKTGAFTFANGGRTVTLTPTTPFAAGEIVWVNLSHDITAADATPLRRGGFAYQFITQVQPSARTFNHVAVVSNRSDPQSPTQIYGALASDLNHDGYTDLATVNESSRDVRVVLNRADGSGEFQDFLTPVAVGRESSPNEPADFNHDGNIDLCVSAAGSGSVWILLGKGDGTFNSVQEAPVGGEPHGIAVLDVDGDGDLDIVNTNHTSDTLSLLRNDGHGVFGEPTYFDSGLHGEYGLSAADMNDDGITDLVVAALDDRKVLTLLGDGNGSFVPAASSRDSGGQTWVLALGDVNGDGVLDVSTANSGSDNGAILLGNGDGTFGPPTVMPTFAHTPSTDLGDLDGDGDLDWVLSVYGARYWWVFTNDGQGHFTFDQQINARARPSCSILYDADNDGDLDLALTDEIADVILFMENLGPPPCSATPLTCRAPALRGASRLTMQKRSDPTQDGLRWTWELGAATTKAEFGDPLTTEDYALCIYDADTLIYSPQLPHGRTCGTVACWGESAATYVYRDRELSPDGMRFLRLTEGPMPGTARIRLSGFGAALELPDMTGIAGPLRVQLQKRSSGTCWGATYSAPFLINDGATFRAKSD